MKKITLLATACLTLVVLGGASSARAQTAPTLDPISDPAAILEDSGLQTVNLAGITDGGDGGQTLTVTATSDNTSVIPDPTVNYTSPNATGSLDYTPVPNASGSAVITVTVSDGVDAPDAVETFTVAVDAVDDASVAVDDVATVTEDDAATTVSVRGNDTDIDSAVEDVTAVTQPTNGTVAITNAGADVSYEPAADYCNDGSPTDDFTYTLSGGSTATVAMTVTCVDDASVAVDDVATVTEDDAATTVSVRGNDTDIDSAVEDVTAVTQPTNGTVAITNAGADVSYEPAADYCNDGSPTDDFTYTLSGGSTATVAMTVTCVDDASVAVDDVATVTEDDAATTVSVRGNDTDIDSAVEDVTAVTQPTNGTVAITNAGADVSYEPAADYCNDGSPTDDFTYTLSGGSTATVAMTVTCVDDASVAVDDMATVTEDDAATTVSVRGNDTDIDSAVEDVTAVTQPTNGTVAITNAGADVSYEPAADYCNDGSPTDDFTYTLSGGSTATVAMTVTCVDDAPVAVDDTATVSEDDAATPIDVLDNDTDIDGGPKTIASATDPAGGTVVVAGDGLSLTYQPDPDFCNTVAGTTDDFDYTLNGGSTATVAVTVDCAPDAVDDTPTVDEDSSDNPIAVLGNDDLGDTPSTVTAVGDPVNGSAAINGAADGVEYTPDADYCNTTGGGTDDFTYTVTDADGDADTATVSVTVDCAPDAADDTATVDEDSAANAIDVLANDDTADATATVTAVTDPANGSAAINGAADGVEYTPDPDFCNTNTGTTDDFDYTVTDGDGDADTATVRVTVTCVNDAPSFAAGPDQTVNEDAGAQSVPGWATAILAGPANEQADQSVAFNVTGNTNPALFAAAPAVAPNGDLTYTPAANAFGTANVTLTLSDDCGGGTPPASCGPTGVDTSGPQTFTITVDNVNDPPTFISGGDLTVEAGTGEQTVPWATSIFVGPANENQTPTFTVTSTDCNPSPIIGGPVVDPNGRLRFTPVDNVTGSCSISVKLSDGVDETAPVTFTLTLVVGGRPTADPKSVSTDGGAPLTIELTGSDPNSLDLTFQVEESDPDGLTCALDGNNCQVDADCDGGDFTVGQGDTCSVPSRATGPFRGSLDTTTPPTNPGGVSADVVYTPDGPSISSAVILATDSVLIKGAAVLSGDIVVNDAAGTMDLESDTTTPAGFAIKADVVNVDFDTVVGGDAFCNAGDFSANCDPLALPAFNPVADPLPPFLVGDVNNNGVTAPKNGSLTIGPGIYGHMVLRKNSTLTLGAGNYSVRSISGENGANLVFSGPTRMTVAGRVFFDNNSTIGAAGQASDVILYAAGIDGLGHKAPLAAEVMDNSVLYANIYAPNGTILLHNNVQATGGLIAQHVEVQNDATVSSDYAFADPPDEFEYFVTNSIGLASDSVVVEINADDSCRDGSGQVVSIAAFDDAAETDGANALTVTLRGCESTGVPVTFDLVNIPIAGTVTGLPSGPVSPPYEYDVIYTPSGATNEREDLVFSISNGVSSVQGTIEINEPPCSVVTAQGPSDSVATDENDPLTITLSGCDPNDATLTFTTTQPACTTCTLGSPVPITDNRPGFSSATVEFNHNETVATAASFDFIVVSGSGIDQATVTIEVNPENIPPVANNDAFDGQLGGVITGNVLDNDTDANLDGLTAVQVGPAPAFASVFTLNPDGSFVYNHNGTANFSDSFQYAANDGSVTGNTATVSISIVAADITVSVSKVGPAGSLDSAITSVPAGINCGAGCLSDSAVFNTTSEIRLEVAATAGFVFTGWTGDTECIDGSILPVADVNCVANFDEDPDGPTGDPILVTIVKNGTGFGTVTSGPAGIDCGATCSATIAGEPRITLSATPAPGSTFAGFFGGPGGDCEDGQLDAVLDTTCTATFNLAQRTLTVDYVAGSGTVTSSPGGINCAGEPCSGIFANGQIVTLTARPDGTSPFAVVWAGDCVPDGTFPFRATVTMTLDATCTVAFN